MYDMYDYAPQQQHEESPFWTIKGNSGREITYCRDHALQACNIGFVISLLRPASSMQEAAAVLEAHMAMRGDPEAGQVLWGSDEGECAQCRKEAS